MAKELIKKPVFKSRAEMYKKPKWEKFKDSYKEFTTNIKRNFQKFLNKIHEKGSQKLTLMIVPHSEKRIINIQISNYIMFFFSVMLIVVVISSVLSISDNQANRRKLIFLETEAKNNKELILEYKKAIEGFSRRFTSFKVDVSKVLKKEEDARIEKKLVEIGDEKIKGLPKELSELEKLKKELLTLENDIYRVGVFKSSYERLLKEIPSLYPLPMKAYISSYFGYRRDPVYTWTREMHSGLDMVVVPGTPILAAANGVVKYAGWMGGYGWMVEIEHKYGFSTRYAHMMGFNSGIYPGATVNRGQVIGYVGSTGKSTGYHLHYEVRVGGQPIDPLPFVQMMQ